MGKINRTFLLAWTVGACLFTEMPVLAFVSHTDIHAGLSSGNEGVRNITSVEAVTIHCPVGTVPRLPYQIWVNYSDGRSEYRQVRWDNAALATEREQADVEKHPAGSRYAVKGYILGDETTESGYPIEASIEVVDKHYEVPSQPLAFPVPLTDVTIDGDNRLTSNRDLAIREIIRDRKSVV